MKSRRRPDAASVQDEANGWATFTRPFAPTGNQVTVLVDAVDGSADLFRQIEAHYGVLLPEIVRAVGNKMSMTPANFERSFQLDMIDLRSHLRPSACVLHYRTDLGFDWYARVSHDYRVASCGELD